MNDARERQPAPGTEPEVPYDASYYSGGGRSHYRDYQVQEQVVERYWLPLIERYRMGLTSAGPGRMLDVGCAYGFLVASYGRRGWAAEGCDISEFAIEQGRKRGIPHLQLGALTDLDYPLGVFDLVTCLDVIEHLSSTTYDAYLDRFHRLLKPGGVLFVATPNAIDCSYNVFSPDWVEGDATHINYRSTDQLTRDFAAYSRTIVHGATPSRGMFQSFRPFRWLPRKANGLVRWWWWRQLGCDTRHSAYLLVAARR